MANEISSYIHDGMELPFEDWSKTLHSFTDLASIIQSTHDAAQSFAIKAINRMQTMRNWLIGYNITLLKNSRNFYIYYPQIAENLIQAIGPTSSDTFEKRYDSLTTKHDYPSDYIPNGKYVLP